MTKKAEIKSKENDKEVDSIKTYTIELITYKDKTLVLNKYNNGFSDFELVGIFKLLYGAIKNHLKKAMSESYVN